MKKTNLIPLALLLVTVFLLNACASAVPIKQARTIEEAYPDRIEKTAIGMSIDDFKVIWPEAKRSGVNENGETFEFVYNRLTLGNDFDRIYTYFYFTNNALVKYESKKGS